MPRPQALQFITQIGPKTTDPVLKNKIRKHARSFVSRSKGIDKTVSLLQFRLIVPDSFGSVLSSSDPENQRPARSPSLSAQKVPPETEIVNCTRFEGLQFADPNISETGACPNCQISSLPRSRSISTSWQSTQMIAHQPSTSLPFQNKIEAFYFDLYRDETSSELSGVFVSSFWTRFLLQESHQEPFVRYAVAAIAALNQAVKTSQLATSQPEAKASSRLQREHAFRLYGKSLAGMQLIPQGANTPLRQLVIAILLVFVFETIQQQPHMAFSHAMVADRLLCHFVRTTPNPVPNNEGLASPATHIIESELLMTFCRFDTQMMTYIDTRSQAMHDWGRVSCQSTIDDMPSSFTDLIEATLYWEVVMRRSGHFIHSTSYINSSLILARPFSVSLPGQTLELNAQNSVYGSPYLVPDSIFLDAACHISDIEKWCSAFVTLSRRIHKQAEDIRTNTAMMFLHLYSITFRIIVQGTSIMNECDYDRFLLGFHEIVTLARGISNNLLEITNHLPAYHFHLSIVPPLLIVLLRCRDGSLRREAIDILRVSRYDGPWDRYMIAAVGKWIMEVEEAGVENGIIPQKARLSLSRLAIGLDSSFVAVQCERERSAVEENGEQEFEWVEAILSKPWTQMGPHKAYMDD